MKCGCKTEVYSRVCGYFRPTCNWNKGKQAEFKDRVTFDTGKALERIMNNEHGTRNFEVNAADPRAGFVAAGRRAGTGKFAN
jgi:hypothetical protein